VSFGFLLLAFVAAANPCRASLVLPPRPPALAVGALVALGTCAALAASGGVVLDALDVSPESFRLATALVLGLEGVRALLLPRPPREPELPGLGAALVPIAFPLLLQPGVVMLALAAGADDIAGRALGALAVAFGIVVLAGTAQVEERGGALLAAGGRLIGALELAVGVALAVDAVRDV
jgi:small neutral amino acid transporter SnatA (MarC family)